MRVARDEVWVETTQLYRQPVGFRGSEPYSWPTLNETGVGWQATFDVEELKAKFVVNQKREAE